MSWKLHSTSFQNLMYGLRLCSGGVVLSVSLVLFVLRLRCVFVGRCWVSWIVRHYLVFTHEVVNALISWYSNISLITWNNIIDRHLDPPGVRAAKWRLAPGAALQPPCCCPMGWPPGHLVDVSNLVWRLMWSVRSRDHFLSNLINCISWSIIGGLGKLVRACRPPQLGNYRKLWDNHRKL